jgi:hypothetical protein
MSEPRCGTLRSDIFQNVFNPGRACGVYVREDGGVFSVTIITFKHLMGFRYCNKIHILVIQVDCTAAYKIRSLVQLICEELIVQNRVVKPSRRVGAFSRR